MNLRVVLLALLTDGPNTGYGLGRLLRANLSHLRTARLQQIYHELHQMALKGLVDVDEAGEGDGPSNKKTYSITSAGEKDLDRSLASRPERAERDGLLLQLHMLHRVPADVLRQNLEHRTEENRQRIAAIQHCAASATGGKRLAAEAALVRLSAEQEWCQAVLAGLTASAADSISRR